MLQSLSCRCGRLAISRPISSGGIVKNIIRSNSNKTEKDNSTGSSPPIDENGLYYGKFTKEEYDSAAKFVKEQYGRLEQDIKGDFNIRENLGKVPQFPQRDAKGSTKVKDLTDLFAQTIKTTGPISLSAYIRQCLTHPEFGYYTTRDPIDTRSGDFITSPEISSIFGEMIGIWLFTVWQSQNSPSNIKIIEFGPGRGTLMHDVLSSFNKFIFKSRKSVKIQINLIEASKVLRLEQWKTLCGEKNSFNTTEEGFNSSKTIWHNDIKWLDTEKDVSNEPGVANYVLAHEFFDALPIKSFQRAEEGWREFLVEHTPSVVNTQPKLASSPSEREPQDIDHELLETEFHLTLSKKETPSSLIPNLNTRFKDQPVGSRIEVCSEAELYIMKMLQLLDNSKGLGAVLVIDYGLADQVPENSLRGIYKHKFVSPFIIPGEVDLSVDVDFGNLVQLASKHCSVYGPIEQGDWLHNIGIGYRVDQLIKQNEGNSEKQEKVYNSYRRLTDKDERSMGKIYKFLGLLPNDSQPPIGFNESL
ncbi:S-adenosyl-L-methionine-dependent methyltransferase [Scheffersomyces xylosifermentans]|uniref:S-adenosyl-L-methionine-dependent methyltransferase n=1 Tax=Scheffersomyces xylosifermentans TaxID=1304137 RepID=UPI00315CFDFA